MIVNFCPQCGPNVFIDEDGCCRGCGCDAVGDGVAAIEALRREAETLKRDRVRYVATINDLLKHAPPLTLEELERFIYNDPATTTLTSTPEGDGSDGQ